ncbi:hypothetical protein Scel_85060 [Streptomyces cellostaticus]|nr:hypothetical protein Scel_85060 [Streptomyces cellostaticus]
MLRPRRGCRRLAPRSRLGEHLAVPGRPRSPTQGALEVEPHRHLAPQDATTAGAEARGAPYTQQCRHRPRPAVPQVLAAKLPENNGPGGEDREETQGERRSPHGCRVCQNRVARGNLTGTSLSGNPTS